MKKWTNLAWIQNATRLMSGAFLTLSLLASPAHASGDDTIAWDKANVDVTNMASIQNGAKLFMNYCLGCHSANFMRYNRLIDIGLTEQQIKEQFLFTTTKVGDTMKAAIDPTQAKEWFGANPPDLTLIARSRAGSKGSGADYLYTYLRTYYRDDTKTTGWNNLAFPNVGMPHALWELQGERQPIFEKTGSGEHAKTVLKGWTEIKPGLMTAPQFDSSVRDLVTYLQWMGEPKQHDRKRLGFGVLLFLLVFTFCAWKLNSAYWKDVK